MPAKLQMPTPLQQNVINFIFVTSIIVSFGIVAFVAITPIKDIGMVITIDGNQYDYKLMNKGDIGCIDIYASSRFNISYDTTAFEFNEKEIDCNEKCSIHYRVFLNATSKNYEVKLTTEKK